LEFDAVAQAQLSNEATALRSKDTEGVSFIDQEPGSEALFELDELGQGSKVPIHAEDRLGHDEEAGPGKLFSGPGELGFQAIEVIVRKNSQGRITQTGSIDETGMAKFIKKKDIIFPDHRGNGADSGGVTAPVSHGGFRLLAGGQAFFELAVRREMPGNQPGSTRPDSELLDCFLESIAEKGLVRQTQIIIRGKIDHALPVPNDFRALGGLDLAQFPPEVPSFAEFRLGPKHRLKVGKLGSKDWLHNLGK
jgi:hypothetical protein